MFGMVKVVLRFMATKIVCWNAVQDLEVEGSKIRGVWLTIFVIVDCRISMFEIY